MTKSTVLIIDDDRFISQGAGVRLQAAGYDTLLANNGATGVTTARAEQPDAIVLDVRMPVMDGLTALQELKRIPETKHIPVVMLSASIVDEAAALDAGASFFIRKPFAGPALVEAIQAATICDRDESVTHVLHEHVSIAGPKGKVPGCES